MFLSFQLLQPFPKKSPGDRPKVQELKSWCGAYTKNDGLENVSRSNVQIWLFWIPISAKIGAPKGGDVFFFFFFQKAWFPKKLSPLIRVDFHGSNPGLLGWYKKKVSFVWWKLWNVNKNQVDRSDIARLCLYIYVYMYYTVSFLNIYIYIYAIYLRFWNICRGDPILNLKATKSPRRSGTDWCRTPLKFGNGFFSFSGNFPSWDWSKWSLKNGPERKG